MDSVITGFVNFFTVLISFFPMSDITVTTQISDFMDTFRGALSIMGVFFPVSIFLFVLSTILTIEIGILAFKTYRWIASNLTLGFIK